MIYYIRLLVWRFLWPKRADSFFRVVNGFSFIGIALGVATLIVVMSVMNGFRHELVDKTLAFNSHITLYPQEKTFPTFEPFLEKLRALSFIKSAIPLKMGEGMISYKGKSSGVFIRSMPWKDLVSRDVLTNKNLMGTFQPFNGQDKVVALGSHLARKLHVRLGETVSVAISEGALTPFGRMPRLEYFKVTAIFESGVSDYDQGVIFMPFPAADIFLHRQGGVDAIELFILDPYHAQKVLPTIAEHLSHPFRAVTWADANKRFFQVVETERNVMFIILSLIVIIASFNIVSGLVILVKDKTKDISLLKSLGVPTKSVLTIFAAIGMSIGASGTCVGVILGCVFAVNLESIRQWVQALTSTHLFDQEFYFLSELPVHLAPLQIAVIAAMSLGFSFLAALYPAWRASKLRPSDGLRYE